MAGPRLRAVLATAALAASLAACGGGGGPGAAATSVVAGATSPATVAQAAAPAAPGAAASGGPAGCTAAGQVSANLASIEDLATSFGAAGIPNAQRWAEEVDEYRPYPADAEWAKLRKELGKYNIDPEVLDAILSCLDNH